jgi:hypothetical protein
MNISEQIQWRISLEDQKRLGMLSQEEIEMLKENPHAYDEDLGGYLVRHPDNPKFEQNEWP